MSDIFGFEVLGQRFGIDCRDETLMRMVKANWAHMACESTEDGVLFRVFQSSENRIRVATADCEALDCAAPCDFLHQLEHEILIRLQLLRSDLLFVHAAVVELDNSACLLIASSGGGKSTTTWALLHHGCHYLSDELAPIDLDDVKVFAYPRALSVKQPPPLPYRMPAEVVKTEHCTLIPSQHLPLAEQSGPLRIAALVYLEYDARAGAPTIRSIGPAESSARVYANVLNHLAHSNKGLRAASQLAQSVPGFILNSAELGATCELLRRTLTNIGQ